MDHLKNYYDNYDEEGRLLSLHGQVEYITTMHYIHQYLRPGMKILETGAGTGRYCIPLAKEGFEVHAVELIQSNLDRLKAKITPDAPVTAVQGNAMDLSAYDDSTFDAVLVLGPLYHLYTREDKLRALNEAVRVAKPSGLIFAAYIMNEPCVINFCFKDGKINEYLEKEMLTEDFHCISKPQDLFAMVRTEEISSLDSELPVERLKLIAADGATNYMRETIDSMDEKTFDIYLKYHLSICERQDLIGASHHTLDIIRKK